jgi:4-hydroxyphenylpyruvate dioxygenase-like putative hemolysin
MSALRNSRHEHFAQLVASGKGLRESFLSVGYSAGNAASCARRLSRNEQVRARIAELQSAAAKNAATRAVVDRDWVLSELRTIAENGESEGARVRALELIGRELVMFVDRTDHRFSWDGDFSKLSEAQLELVIKQLDAMAVAHKEAQQRALPAASIQIIDVEPSP